MKHTDVLKKEYIEEYENTHRMLYRTLSMMISDISYLEAYFKSIDDQFELFDWTSLFHLQTAIFESLIIKTYRLFYDDTYNDNKTIYRFKNKIMGNLINERFKDDLINEINQIPKIDDHKTEAFKKNIIILRNKNIAHGTIDFNLAQVCLQDIKDFHKYGCKMFQKLSFEPANFYEEKYDGVGYDFEKENIYTKKAYFELLNYVALSSSYITSIKCDLAPYCDDDVMKKINNIIEEINKAKKETI